MTERRQRRSPLQRRVTHKTALKRTSRNEIDSRLPNAQALVIWVSSVPRRHSAIRSRMQRLPALALERCCGGGVWPGRNILGRTASGGPEDVHGHGRDPLAEWPGGRAGVQDDACDEALAELVTQCRQPFRVISPDTGG